MEKLIVEKLQNVRKSLFLNESETARQSGYSQSGISQLESGKMKSIPTILLSFYAKKNINLTALFNNEITLEKFDFTCLDTPKSNQGDDKCQKCAEKDKEIILLKEHLQDLRMFLPKK